MANEPELEHLRQHAEDCDRRLLSIEGEVRHISDDVSSLRATRHEYGNWLNRHNLELNTMDSKLGIVDREVVAMKVKVEEQGRAVVALSSDAKVLAWKIGVILAVLVFIANQAASRIHF